MKKLIPCFLSFCFLLGCSLNPDVIDKRKLDFILDQNYPIQSELKQDSERMLIVFAPSVTLNSGKNIQKILKNIFLTKSNIITVFNSNLSFEEAIDFSKDKGIEYTAIIEQSLSTSKPHFNIVFYHTLLKQLILEKSWTPSRKSDNKNFESAVTVHFPLKGFITETKGNRIIVKINLGKKLNVKKGDFFAVYSRKIIATTKPSLTSIYTQTTIKFSKNYLAKVRVFFLDDEYSWALVYPKDSKNIKAGMPVFSFTK